MKKKNAISRKDEWHNPLDLNLMPKQVYDITIVNKHINKHKKKLVKLTGLLSLSS